MEKRKENCQCGGAPVDIPNDETIEAFREIENGGGCTFAGTIEEFFKELLEE